MATNGDPDLRLSITDAYEQHIRAVLPMAGEGCAVFLADDSVLVLDPTHGQVTSYPGTDTFLESAEGLEAIVTTMEAIVADAAAPTTDPTGAFNA
jgi:hypothetical protein